MWIWIANNLQNFTQKDLGLTEVKIFKKVLGGGAETPGIVYRPILKLNWLLSTEWLTR